MHNFLFVLFQTSIKTLRAAILRLFFHVDAGKNYFPEKRNVSPFDGELAVIDPDLVLFNPLKTEYT